MEKLENFAFGFMFGIIAAAIAWAVAFAVENARYADCRDKMTIEYEHAPNKGNPKIFTDLVRDSGVQTNFLNREFRERARTIRCTLWNTGK